jgi:C1A family cysteine protease
MRPLLLAAALLSAVSFAAPKGWTFKFDPRAPKRATGAIVDNVHRSDPKNYIKLSKLAAEQVIPDTYDLRNKGIQQIRDQGACGSCWAFSVTAAFYDALVQSGKSPVNLSEQYLVDCDDSSYGCGGGYFTAFDMLVDPLGAPSLASYPYQARTRSCKSKPIVESAVDWKYLGKPKIGPPAAEIQRALMEFGGVSVDVSASGPFGGYKSGIYNACYRGSINHMVNIVGWNNEGAVANADGVYPPGKGYWIMRNSWSKNWGEDGYMRIRYTDTKGNKCNRIGWTAAVAIVK